MKAFIISDCDNTAIYSDNAKLSVINSYGTSVLTEDCLCFTPCAINNSLNIVVCTRGGELIVFDTHANSEHFHTTGICQTMHIMSCRDKLNLIYTINNELILKSKSYGGYISSGCVLSDIKSGTAFRAAGYGDRSVIFFIRCMPEQQLGFISLGASYIGQFRKVYSTGYSITDYSLYVSEGLILAAVLVNRGLTSAIVYVRIDDSGTFTRCVYEGMGISLVRIEYSAGSVSIYWHRSKRCCSLTSPDMGQSFYRKADTPRVDGGRVSVVRVLDSSIALSEWWQ